MTPLDRCTWPLERLGEALEELARRGGLAPQAGEALVPPAGLDADGLARWVDWAATRLGIEAEAVDAAVPDVPALVRDGAPALLRLPRADGDRLALLVGAARLLGPDGREHRVDAEALRAALCAPHEAPLEPEIAALLEAAAVAPTRRGRVRAALLAERLATKRVGGCWILRPAPGRSFVRQLAQARVPGQIGWMLGLFALVYACEIAAWKLIGEAALDGRLDRGWLAGWLLLMATMIPLQIGSGWFDARFALDAGRLLKQRLFGGALRADLDTLRREGSGRALGRVMESQALEGLALGGGLGVLLGALELAFAAWILSSGAAPALHVALLAAWLGLVVALAWRHLRALRRWTAQRVALTEDLVERMVGHRTRLAQERAGRRDAADDRAMQDYLAGSAALDATVPPLVSLVPTGWIVAGLLALAPAFAAGTAGPGALAVSLGGMLFAHRAFNAIGASLASLGRAAIAWEQVRELFAAATPDAAPAPFIADAVPAPGAPLVEAAGVVFRHGEGEPVIRGADLRIGEGERVLLDGASGGGKSTLAALLTGLRAPGAGLLLVRGLDRHTLGDAVHRLVTEAPQFHENHVLGGTLAFNLLMGRHWPASEAEVAEAKALCEDLGLGPLIARMPAGMNQRVGETGWQLSHGERSRLFLARALLQKAPLTILDESFAALDPPTLARCLDATLARTRALMVIAHP